MRWCAVALLLAFVSAPAVLGARSCQSAILDASPVFGAADRANLVGYSQEQEWKKEGSITKVVLYVDEQYGCVQGIKAVYGATASPLIGINKRGNRPIKGKDLKLEDGEVIMGLEYRAGRCVEYLRLITSKGRSLQGGSPRNASSFLTVRAPPGGYLGFLRGFTARFTTLAKDDTSGPLERLQLVWVKRGGCGLSATDVMASAESVKRAIAQGNGTSTPGQTGPSPLVSETSKICSAVGCSYGACPTSSCSLNAMGSENPLMTCFGTNVMSSTSMMTARTNPCVNLACRLDRPNCQSAGMSSLGDVGAFCTGRVVSMGAAAQLSDFGKAVLGHPCVEHTGPLLRIMTWGDYTARGRYISKAWKICDCSLASKFARFRSDGGTIRANSSSGSGAGVRMASADSFDRDLAEAEPSGPDGSNSSMVAVPTVGSSSSAQLLGQFSNLVAEVASFTANTVGAAAARPFNGRPGPGQNMLAGVASLADTVAGMASDSRSVVDVAQRVMSVVTPKGSTSNVYPTPMVMTQWLTGLVFNSPLVDITPSDSTLSKLQALLPGLPGSTPSLLVYNISTPYFTTPKTVGGNSKNLEVLRDMRVFVIPDETTDRVANVLPGNATSLPFVLSPSKASPKLDSVQTSKLVLSDVTMNLLKQTLNQMLPSVPGLPVDGLDVMEIASQPLMSVNVSFPLIDSLTSVADRVKGMAPRGLGVQIPKLPGSTKQAVPSYAMSSRMRMPYNASAVAKNDSLAAKVTAASVEAVVKGHQESRKRAAGNGKIAAAPNGITPAAGLPLSKVPAPATSSQQGGAQAPAALNTHPAVPGAAAPAMSMSNPPVKLIKTEPVSMKIMPAPTAPTAATANVPAPAQTPKATTPSPPTNPQRQSGSPTPPTAVAVAADLSAAADISAVVAAALKSADMKLSSARSNESDATTAAAREALLKQIYAALGQ